MIRADGTAPPIRTPLAIFARTLTPPLSAEGRSAGELEMVPLPAAWSRSDYDAWVTDGASRKVGALSAPERPEGYVARLAVRGYVLPVR